MKKHSARFELHSAGKMRIEDLFVDSQSETGVSIPTNVRTDINDVINGTHKTFRCPVRYQFSPSDNFGVRILDWLKGNSSRNQSSRLVGGGIWEGDTHVNCK